MRSLVVNIDYQKENKTIFKAVHFAGYVGVVTGMKPGAFTLTVNERFGIDGGYIGILEWMLGIRTGHWIGFLVRNILENAKSYKEAKDMLTTTELLAPAYFILCGATSGEGCVITRSREKVDDIWEMRNANGWYILETNYDHWKNPMVTDDRRTPANKCMKNLTQKAVSFKGLYNVLSTKPVLNKLTAYTALMQVDIGQLETWIQDCPNPCWPWVTEI